MRPAVGKCDYAPGFYGTDGDKLHTCLPGDRAVSPAHAVPSGGQAVGSNVIVLGTRVFRLQRETCAKGDIGYYDNVYATQQMHGAHFSLEFAF